MDWLRLKDQCAERLQKLQEAVTRRMSHTYLLPEGKPLMELAISELIRRYAGRGLSLQEFSFYDGEYWGRFLQIKNESGSVHKDLLRFLGGQQISVGVRFLPTSEGLRIQVSQGRWLDKMVSGALSWSVFLPLLAFPICGGLKQKKLMERIEADLIGWLQNQPEGKVAVRVK